MPTCHLGRPPQRVILCVEVASVDRTDVEGCAAIRREADQRSVAQSGDPRQRKLHLWRMEEDAEERAAEEEGSEQERR